MKPQAEQSQIQNQPVKGDWEGSAYKRPRLSWRSVAFVLLLFLGFELLTFAVVGQIAIFTNNLIARVVAMNTEQATPKLMDWGLAGASFVIIFGFLLANYLILPKMIELINVLNHTDQDEDSSSDSESD